VEKSTQKKRGREEKKAQVAGKIKKGSHNTGRDTENNYIGIKKKLGGEGSGMKMGRRRLSGRQKEGYATERRTAAGGKKDRGRIPNFQGSWVSITQDGAGNEFKRLCLRRGKRGGEGPCKKKVRGSTAIRRAHENRSTWISTKGEVFFGNHGGEEKQSKRHKRGGKRTSWGKTEILEKQKREPGPSE